MLHRLKKKIVVKFLFTGLVLSENIFNNSNAAYALNIEDFEFRFLLV